MNNYGTRIFGQIIATLACIAMISTTNAEPPQLPSNVSQYLESGWFGEDWMLEDTGGKLTEFTNYMTSNWVQVLDNFDAVAPTIRKKLVILAACEALSPTDYLAFLEKLARLSQAPGFDVKVWNGVISPTKLKEGFLAYNYQNPRVSAVINRIVATIPADDPHRPEIQKIVNGQAKQDFLDYNAAYNKGNVDTIALPSQ